MTPGSNTSSGLAAPLRGDPIVGRATWRWALAGLATGALAGALAGAWLARGHGALPGLGPLVAGGVQVTAFVCGGVCAALLGLVAALAATLFEARRMPRRVPPVSEWREAWPTSRVVDAGQQPAPPATWPHPGATVHEVSRGLAKLPVVGAFVLALLMLGTFALIAARGAGRGEPSDQSNRVTWDQANVARLGGATDAETLARVLETAWPATEAANTPDLLVMAANDWRIALAATSLIAAPTHAAVIAEAQDPSVYDSREIHRLRQAMATVGARRSTLVEELAVAPDAGPVPPQPVATLALGTAPEPGGQVLRGSPAAIAAAIDARRSAITGMAARAVLVVSADADPRIALPAGAYAARTGTSILFVGAAGVPPETAQALRRRGGFARVYVLGSEAAVSADIARSLGAFGTVTRISGPTWPASAVAFAEFRDAPARFGWGRTGRGARDWTPSHAILAPADDWRDAVHAAHLARAGASGPLLLTGRDRLPAVIDQYLWRQRPVFAGSPTEAAANHLWVVGSFARIGYRAQAWADWSQEISPYKTLGDSAVSGLEAVSLVWLALSVACAIWLAAHAVVRLPDVAPAMKASWAATTLMLGPIALALYISSYHHRARVDHGDGTTGWVRPGWARAVSATVMMYGFDMLLMALAVFALTASGVPTVSASGPLFWLGSSMFLRMLGMFAVAWVLSTLLFHAPMLMTTHGIPTWRRAVVAGAPIMLVTMLGESLGMMPALWWAQTVLLPAMQWPTQDDLAMWTTLLFAAAVGFLVVLPVNHWLVLRGMKAGNA